MITCLEFDDVFIVSSRIEKYLYDVINFSFVVFPGRASISKLEVIKD